MDKFEKLLAEARSIKDKFQRSLFVLGILTGILEKERIRPILVGGGAVEFYTLGNYTTYDLDLVINGREVAAKVLERMGFSRLPGARHWFSEELDLAIEVPDEYLAGSKEKVVEVEVKGLKCYVIGIEDLIIDRVNAYVHRRSESDGEWAVRLMSLHKDEIDWDYLDQRAVEDKLIHALKDLKKRAGV